jgi:hypothetical protein
MPDVPERGHPGIYEEKQTSSEEQDEQWRSPDQVAEIDDVLAESFQNDRVGSPKIIIITLVACISISCYLCHQFFCIKPNFIHCYENRQNLIHRSRHGCHTFHLLPAEGRPAEDDSDR